MGIFAVGDKVRFIDATLHKKDPDFFPERGTIGEVMYAGVVLQGEQSLCIRWPKGSTSLRGDWWTLSNSVEKIESNESEEPEMRAFQEGDKVQFLDEAAHSKAPDVFPPVGTIGTVHGTGDGNHILQVQWPSQSTSSGDLWICGETQVAKVITITRKKTRRKEKAE